MNQQTETKTVKAKRKSLYTADVGLESEQDTQGSAGYSAIETQAKGLGVFSLALGLAEVALTRSLAKAAGISPQYSTILRIFGLREITSGVGLLAGSNRKAWLWSRVAGDILDVGFMGYAFTKAKNAEDRKRLAIAAAVVAPIIILDVMASLRESARVREVDEAYADGLSAI